MPIISTLLLIACLAPDRLPAKGAPQDTGSAKTAEATTAKLIARLVDEMGRPRPNLNLHYFSCTDGESPDPGRDGWLRSDASGRIELGLLPSELSQFPRYFELSDLGWHSPTGEQLVDFYLPDDFHSGLLDLGSLLIAPRGVSQRFAGLDDAQLRANYERLQTLASPRGQMYEEFLCEFVRRGGSGWAEYVEGLFEKQRPPPGQTERSWSAGPTALSLLTAARRLRGRPDPLSIRVEEGARLEFSATEHPLLRLRWRNVDKLESITIDPPEAPGSRYGRVNLEATDSAGQTLARPQAVSSGGDNMSGMIERMTLAPGEEIQLTVDLVQYVQQVKPGVYRVRVRYHDEEWIAERPHLGGLILSASPEITVRIHEP